MPCCFSHSETSAFPAQLQVSILPVAEGLGEPKVLQITLELWHFLGGCTHPHFRSTLTVSIHVVITLVALPIAVNVPLVVVLHVPAVVTDVTKAVLVCIALVRIAHKDTVVLPRGRGEVGMRAA